MSVHGDGAVRRAGAALRGAGAALRGAGAALRGAAAGASLLATVAGAAPAGCAAPAGAAAEEPVEASLAPYVLEELPSDVPNRTFIDFEGKVQLLGWSLEPEGPLAPGSRAKLTMWWRCSADLPEPFALFTHVLAADGSRVMHLDDTGPLRARQGDGPQALGPGRWRPGRVYVDTQELQVPRDLATTDLTFAVGVWRYFALPGKDGQRDVRGLRLAVLSGPSDAQNRALVARARTTWQPPAPR
ncbi:MAG: hypothetical protein IT376_17575 [Polyangiaceae bacterium]|nr:hypothetical protein [Polyangiaceae bacterium]